MKLKLLLQLAESKPVKLAALVLLGITGGLCSFVFITLVNKAITMLFNDELKTIDAAMAFYFLAVITVFIAARWLLSRNIIEMTQRIYWNIRKDIIRAVLNSNYQKIAASKDGIYSVLTNDANSITQASLSMIELMTSLILVTSCFVYMAAISLTLFGISMGIIMLGAGIYQLRIARHNASFKVSRDLEQTFLRYFNAILGGVKEINIENKKGKAIYDNRVFPVSEQAFENNKSALTGYLNNQIIGQILFYTLIACIILFSGFAFGIEKTVIVSFVMVLLYVLGPIESIMVSLPVMNRAIIAANRMLELKAGLESDTGKYIEMKKEQNIRFEFDTISINGLHYQYITEKNTFELGPIDLRINKGDVIFIHGGNGSGKSTFIYSLLHLYKPMNGSIKVNDKEIKEENSTEYKRLFSPVFSDFYLFDEFYGVENVDMNKLRSYLKLFEIENKVTVEEGKFSSTDLSTGQRKRLALIAALLEKKPIIILDEWAADQDPGFREKFYTVIIPFLKQQGFTVVAITHDDKYYYCADKLYQMDFGKLIPSELTEVAYPGMQANNFRIDEITNSINN